MSEDGSQAGQTHKPPEAKIAADATTGSQAGVSCVSPTCSGQGMTLPQQTHKPPEAKIAADATTGSIIVKKSVTNGTTGIRCNNVAGGQFDIEGETGCIKADGCINDGLTGIMAKGPIRANIGGPKTGDIETSGDASNPCTGITIT